MSDTLGSESSPLTPNPSSPFGARGATAASSGVGDTLVRNIHYTPGADSERIRALHARAETQLRDEPDPTVGGIDPEALRSVKPVIAIDRAWTVVLSVGHPLLDSGRD